MAIPKYQHIKDELKQQIISGKFENGDKFYTEAELIKIYDVSSITVVRALNDLAADGYIVRQQGKGTFVSRARKHKLVEFSDVETFPIQKAKVKVLSIKRKKENDYKLKTLDRKHGKSQLWAQTLSGYPTKRNPNWGLYRSSFQALLETICA